MPGPPLDAGDRAYTEPKHESTWRGTSHIQARNVTCNPAHSMAEIKFRRGRYAWWIELAAAIMIAAIELGYILMFPG